MAPRPDRPVNQTRGQDFLFRWTALALEEATRDLAGGIGFLDLVNGQREKIETRARLSFRHHGAEHGGFVISDEDRAVRLTR